MGLLDKMAARRAKPKAFVEPPFWEVPEPLWTTSYSAGEEKIGHDYMSYAEYVFKSSPAVFAAVRFRAAVLSEARFKWRTLRGGPEGDLFGTPELGLLEYPWTNGSTSDLLARMEVTSSLAGNYYATLADDEGRLGRSARGNRRIVHMRPDWTTIIIDSASGDPNALDARVVGYVYDPPGAGSGFGHSNPVTLLPTEVVHFAPGLPDPLTRFRGMSWLTPILPEVRADKAATVHTAKFFENGASPQMVVTLSSDVSPDKFAEYVAAFKAAHTGADNAYKTLFLAGGADARSMGATPQQLDLKPLQGMAETRIAMAAGIHPTVLGMSDGLQGSSLNAGNFNAAQRLASSGTFRAWWRNACHSWETLITPPSGSELWYDDRDIAFLRADGTDLAAIRSQNAATLASLVMNGWKPDAAIDYLASNDVTRLRGQHTNLLPVQLQPPGSGEEPSGASPRPGASSNGTRNGSEAAVPR
jgi:phage portal protein BeeE